MVYIKLASSDDQGLLSVNLAEGTLFKSAMFFPWLQALEIQREIPYVIYHLSNWNLKYDQNELIHETETDPQIQRTSGYQWGEGGWRGKIGVGH